MAPLQPTPEANSASRENDASSPFPSSFAVGPVSTRGRHSPRFVAGVALIAASFLVYLAYPIILLTIPFSPAIKVGAAAGVWCLSWATFSAGVFLAGPEGREWLKRLWSHLIAVCRRHPRNRKGFSARQSETLGGVDSIDH